jgi:chloride channel 3/4/5
LPEDWANEDTTGRRIHYQDFTTIDWIHDLTKERLRLKRLRTAPGLEGKLWSIFDASQAWIVVSLIGISAGIAAAFIDIVSEWLGDMKTGYCKTDWYLNKRFCCWEEPLVEGAGSVCQYWQNWAGDGTSAGQYILNYFMYILFALLFSCTAAILVRQYAPYAAGSGIPEVKTILSGFIIRKFLGWWTLITKSLGLSFSVASGLTLGKEGPLVHVACCCGNLFPRMFKKYARNEGIIQYLIVMI